MTALLLILALLAPGPPRPTHTPHASPTATATMTANPSPTPRPTPTATPTPLPQGATTPDGGTCLGIPVIDWCPRVPDLIHTFLDPFGTVVAGGLSNWFGVQWDVAMIPFNHALTTSPDLSTDDTFSQVRQLQSHLQIAGGVLFVGLLVLGVFAGALGNIGQPGMEPLITPIRRAVLVSGGVAGYPQIMGLGFNVVTGLTDLINDAPIATTTGGLEAMGNLFMTLAHSTGPMGIVYAAVDVVGFLCAALSVVTREAVLGVEVIMYSAGPLMLFCWLFPPLAFIAKYWFRLMIASAVLPVAYALILKVSAVLLAEGGYARGFGDIVSALAALGLAVLLLHAWRYVNDMAGAATHGVGSIAAFTVATGTQAAMTQGKKLIPAHGG